MEIFMKKLWAKWLKDEYEASRFWVNSFYNIKLGVPWTSERKIMKVFHYNDPNIRIPSKCGEYHDARTRQWWGHIYTNKFERSNDRYALLFSPDGKRANQLNRSTFLRLCEGSVEHIYPEFITENTVNDFIKKVPHLSKFQAHRLFTHLTGRSPHLTSTTDAIGCKPNVRGSWVHVFLED